MVEGQLKHPLFMLVIGIEAEAVRRQEIGGTVYQDGEVYALTRDLLEFRAQRERQDPQSSQS